MAFKMKGAPQHDLSSKHGTNANFKKSGPPLMKGLGKLAGNFIKGKGAMGLLNPVGAMANKMGAFGGNNNNQQAQPMQQAPNPNPPVQPAGPAPTAPTMAEEAAPTMMKKNSSMTMKKKAGAPMVKIVKPDLKVKKGRKPQPMPLKPSKPLKSKRKNPMLMKDLSGDGKITQKDVLIGRGVIKKPGASMKKSPMEKGGDGCGGNFKVNKPGTVVSRALKRAGGSVKRGLDNVVDNIKKGNKKRKKKRNTVKAPKNTGGGGHIVRSSTSYN